MEHKRFKLSEVRLLVKQIVKENYDLEAIKREKDAKYDQLMKDCQLFFAFSNEQFAQNKPLLQVDDKFVSIGHGGYMPKSKVEIWRNGIKELKDWYQQALSDAKSTNPNIEKQEILDSLLNHEAFYTGDIEDTFNDLGGRYTMEQIQKVYNANKRKYQD